MILDNMDENDDIKALVQINETNQPEDTQLTEIIKSDKSETNLDQAYSDIDIQVEKLSNENGNEIDPKQ